MDKLPITAFVVACNEASYLAKCLPMLSFCNEIILIDLASTDETLVIARQWADRVIEHTREAIVEKIRLLAPDVAKYDWILFVDPDEIYPPNLQAVFYPMLASSTVGQYFLPMQYYFRNYPLKGTIWGGIHYRPALIHRKRVGFTAVVHRDIELKPPFLEYYIPKEGMSPIAHHWATGWQHLWDKHHRYLDHEGESLYQAGWRYSWVKQVIQPLKAFRASFWLRKGYRDGWLGFLLSGFWTWYTWQRWRELARYEMENTKR